MILVDGCSSDDTVQVAQQLRPDIITIGQTRKGKGNALACGFAVASGDFIVMLDADGSANPSEIRVSWDVLEVRRRLRQGLSVHPREVGAATSADFEGWKLLAEQGGERSCTAPDHGPLLWLQRFPP